MKKIMLILGAVLLVVAVGAGSFWGGIAYQSSKANEARANFEAIRGQAPGNSFGGGNMPGNSFFGGNAPDVRTIPGGQGIRIGGSGSTGVVKSVDGDRITISTAESVVSVKLSENTQIEQTVMVGSEALTPGTRVIISGETDDDGNVTAADRIMILGDAAGTPPVSTTEP